MARSRPGDDRGQEPGEDRELCGVHPTTAFRWRHRFLRAPADDKPRTLSGIVEADETFILESFKGRWSDLPRAARKRGGTARHPGPYQDNIPVLVARDRKGATSTPFCRRPRRLDRRRADRDRDPRKSSRRRWRQAPGRLRAQGQDSLPRRAFAGKANPQAPHLHINNVNAYHSRLKQWLSRFNGVATKNLPSYLGWRRALEAWGRRTRSAKMDPRRNRKRAIPTDNAIRATIIGSYSVSC